MSTPLGPDYRRLWSASAISNLGDGVATVAYPWLASAVTRDPIQIALIAVAVRLPWLVFSLPAGVVTDRVDRRRLVASMDALRFAVTGAVALVVFFGSGRLAGPEAVAAGTAATPDPAWPFLVALYAGALLLGLAEVFRDNAAQTLMPAIVEQDQLERANGRLWGVEMVMNSFVGPPLGGLLIAVAFALPFGLNAASFGVAALIVWSLRGDFRPSGATVDRRSSWRSELVEGVRWLWQHRLLRTMALILGVMNAAFSAALAVYVLFVQEVLGLSAASFGALLTAGALGGVIGSVAASRVSRRIGPGASLYASLLGGGVALAVTGLTSAAAVVWVAFVVFSFLAVLWNVITVSLRQSIIPDRLLGRVNSVYRFLAWGMMPVGALLGGVVVTVSEPLGGRELALRMPFLLAAAAYFALFVVALPRLSTRRIEEARAAA
jgi:MFS family permease